MAGENYRRVVPSFWTDPDVKRKLTLEQKALLLYFFTSPHSNMIGLYYLPLGYVASETGLGTEAIRLALAGVLAPFVVYDEDTEEVFVRRSAFHQMGELHGADKRKEGVRRLLQGVHSTRLRRAFLEQYASWELGVVLPDTRQKAKKPLPKPLSDATEGATQAIAVAVAVADTVVPPNGGPPATWLTPFSDAWRASRGEPNHGQLAKRLRPVVLARGHRQALLVWVGYLEDRREKGFCSPEDFAGSYEVYRRKWGVVFGEDGTEMTVPDEPEVVAA